MRLRLRSERALWLAIVGVGLLALLLLIFWAVPEYDAAERADADWTMADKELKQLKRRSKEIPSASSLENFEKLSDWTEGQADLIVAFLKDRTDLMYDPLVGPREKTAADFKSAYVHAVKRQQEWLRRNEQRGIMQTSGLGHVFPEYKWAGTSPALPKPSEFRKILLDYWSRYYLYRTFRDGGVRMVRRLDIKERSSLTPQYDGVSVSADVLLPPGNITRLARTFLKVSRVARTPVYQLESFAIRAAPEASEQKALVEVRLVAYVVLVKGKK